MTLIWRSIEKERGGPVRFKKKTKFQTGFIDLLDIPPAEMSYKIVCIKL